MGGTLISAAFLLLVAQRTSGTESDDVNVANLHKLASLTPDELYKTLHYLENPYVAAALVESDKRSKPVHGKVPPAFDEPLLNSDLQNYLLKGLYRQEGAPHTVDGVLRNPILGSYFQHDEDLAPDEKRIREHPDGIKSLQ